MTTMIFDLVRIGYDAQGTPDDFAVVEVRASFFSDLTTLTYTVDQDGLATFQNGLFNVEFSDGANFATLGFVIGEQSWTTNTALSGTSQLMYAFDPITGTEYYGAIGGDPIPVTSLQDVLDLEFEAVGSPSLLTGDLAPGANVLASLIQNDPDYMNLRVVENDIYNIDPNTTYFVVGGAGDDVINGQFGEWTYVVYDDLSGAIDVNLIKGWAKKDGIGRDVLNSVEDIHGTVFDDRIVGDNNAEGNYFFGGDGNDIMRGKGAADFIAGEDGNDKIFGDDGADELEGGDGEDTIEGGTGDDYLIGGADRDVMRGNQDNDQMFGGTGDDRMLGGTGVDQLYGEDGDDDIYGQGGDDYLEGDKGIDRLYGDRDNDRLDGGEDNDFLFGGAGSDVFVFENIEDMGRDRIKDWQDGRDKIDVSDYGFTDFADVLAIADDTASGLRIKFDDDLTGDTRLVYIENFLKADFDETDVILEII